MKKPEDPFYRKVYDILHSTMDRMTEAAGAVSFHADILDPDRLEGKSAMQLLQAQREAGGSEGELEFLQMLIIAAHNLLIQHHARESFSVPDPGYDQTAREATRP